MRWYMRIGTRTVRVGKGSGSVSSGTTLTGFATVVASASVVFAEDAVDEPLVRWRKEDPATTATAITVRTIRAGRTRIETQLYLLWGPPYSAVVENSDPIEWQTQGARVLHDDVIRIEEHDVRTPAGQEFAFPMILSPGFAKVVPILPNGDVVLVRQYRYAIGLVTLEVPAGALSPGEDPLECARRELGEETFLMSDALEALGEFCTSPGRMNERGYIFLATNCRPDPTARQDEPTEPVAMPLKDAVGLIGTGILAAPSSLALLLAQRRLAGLDR